MRHSTTNDASGHSMNLRDELERVGKTLYCVSFTPRSGSTLLCQDLRRGGLGDPAEWFQSPLYVGYRLQRSVADYVMGHVACSSRPVVGFKISWGQACVLTQALGREGQPVRGTDLAAVFPELRFIHLSRRDKIQQSVSCWRAVATGQWHYLKGDERLTGGPRYDFTAIKRHYERILVEDALWDSYFTRQGIRPFRLEYEDYTASRLTTIETIAKYLDAELTCTSLADELGVMRDTWTDGIVERFWSDMNDLADTKRPGAFASAYRRLIAATHTSTRTLFD